MFIVIVGEVNDPVHNEIQDGVFFGPFDDKRAANSWARSKKKEWEQNGLTFEIKPLSNPNPIKVVAKPVLKTGKAVIEKNLRKLDRRVAKEPTPKEKLRTITRHEGVDAALSCAKRLGFSKQEAKRLIMKWV